MYLRKFCHKFAKKKVYHCSNILMLRISLKLLLKWLFLCTIFWYLLFHFLSQSKQDLKFQKKPEFITPNVTIKNHFAIYSSIYYNVSKLYSSNSMIILLNTHQDIQIDTINFQCLSKNATASISSDLQIRMTNWDPAQNCQWEAFIANCTTVSNPKYFGITSTKSSKIIPLDFETPVSETYPVVMCYAPMLYEARWQQLIFATEMYHYFGADMQVQYVNSAMKQIMKILRIYEKKKWIKIQEFTYFDFGTEIINDIGFHPMKEIISRNQHLALSDCVMRYREASEFVIIADIDEILFPKHGNYYSEFSKWNKMFPVAAAFIYPRSYAKIDTPNEFKNFSLSNVIKSIKISESSFMGKAILRTDRVETPWIHWPGLSIGDSVRLKPEDGIIFHVQIAAEKIRAVKAFYELGGKEELNTLKPYFPLSKQEIKSIDTNFVSSFKNLTNFKASWVYANILFDCFKESEHWNRDYCYTPFRCKIPTNITNFECETVGRNFSKKALDDNSIFYLQQSDYYWVKSKDNCRIFNK